MRIAVISDTHASPRALEAVLADAHAAGAEALWHLGDACDWGTDPARVVERLRAEADLSVSGNHDLLTLGAIGTEDFSKGSLVSRDYTRALLEDEHLAYLAGLPAEAHPEGTGCHLAHGSPRDPAWEYVSTHRVAEAVFKASRARVVLVGHTHVPRLYRERADLEARAVRERPARPGERVELGADRWIVNPGSVGNPTAKRDPRAQWLLLDLGADTLELRRSDYDWRSTRQDILDSWLPDSFAKGLGG